MTKWKISDSDFGFIEDEVRLYPLYKNRLEQAINDIYYSTPSYENTGGGKSNLPSRPVENKVFSLLHDARIVKLRLYVESVEEAFHELDKEKQDFIDLLYWKNRSSLQAVCLEFCISVSTANRWRKAFIMRVGLLTGDKRDIG